MRTPSKVDTTCSRDSFGIEPQTNQYQAFFFVDVTSIFAKSQFIVAQ